MDGSTKALPVSGNWEMRVPVNGWICGFFFVLWICHCICYSEEVPDDRVWEWLWGLLRRCFCGTCFEFVLFALEKLEHGGFRWSMWGWKAGANVQCGGANAALTDLEWGRRLGVEEAFLPRSTGI